MNLKEKLREIVFKYVDENNYFDFYFLVNKVNNWPKNENESQSLESFSCLELNDDFMLIHCGGDWQKPMEIKIECHEDKLYCIKNKIVDKFNDNGLSNFNFLNQLFDGKAKNLFGNIVEEDENTEVENETVENSEPVEIIRFEEHLENRNYLPHHDILRKINEIEFPFKDNSFFKYNPTELGADEFKRCVNLILERNNNNEGNPSEAMMLMMELIQIEAPHKEELQNLAIKLIKEMYDIPDTLDLKAMIEMKNPEEECDCGGNDEEDNISDERKKELQPEIEKRRILNSIVHGCAVHQWTSAYHLVRNELGEINTELLAKYNKLSALVNYWNWKMYFEPMFEVGQMPTLQGINKVDVKNKEIEASGMNFPVLIHELSKGVMDYLISIGIPKNVARIDVTEEELKYIYAEADKYAHEQWHYFFGPTLWRAMLKVAEVTTQELPPIISKMAKMNYKELSDFCIDVVFDSENKGKEKMNKLIKK